MWERHVHACDIMHRSCDMEMLFIFVCVFVFTPRLFLR